MRMLLLFVGWFSVFMSAGQGSVTFWHWALAMLWYLGIKVYFMPEYRS